MKKYIALVLMLASCATRPQTTRISNSSPSIQVYFAPGDDPETAIVAAVDAAQTQILMQSYYFTSGNICSAIKRAQRNGVQVKLLKDKHDSKECVEELIRGHHVSVREDDDVNIAHNKVMVIDAYTLITGSYNFTNNAHHNAENLLIIKDSSIARKYMDNWWDRYDKSYPTR